VRLRAADEDEIIGADQRGKVAALSDEVHTVQRPDLGGWTGGTVWEASQVLARVLAAQPAAFWRARRRVVELGCGCGLVGLAAAALGAREVVLTDQVLFVAKHNLRRNATGAGGAALRRRAKLSELRWGDAAGIARLRPPFDLVLGSDIMYYPAHYRALADTIGALSGARTEVLLVTRDGVPTKGEAGPHDSRAAAFYARVAAWGFDAVDASREPAMAAVLKLVRRRYTAEQSGRGPLRVVRMLRRRARRPADALEVVDAGEFDSDGEAVSDGGDSEGSEDEGSEDETEDDGGEDDEDEGEDDSKESEDDGSEDEGEGDGDVGGPERTADGPAMQGVYVGGVAQVWFRASL
jgi:predicted nicotinamide N-methyase